MIKVRLNSEMLVLQADVSLAEIMANQAYVATHFAVAVNRRFIPRSVYATTFLQDGDVIEIISPMQGG